MSDVSVLEAIIALHDVMFIEPSPGPVKYAAKLLGLCSDEMRLPMTPITEATEIKVKDAMVQGGSDLTRHAENAGADAALIVHPITTNHLKKGCFNILKPSVTLQTFQLLFIIFPLLI
jgi:dihydrodipicolinate synthase/N-acetylneuraminate lyase